MTHTELMDTLTEELNTELTHYARFYMGIEDPIAIDAFVDGYFECFTLGDDNDNDTHWINKYRIHIDKVKARS